MRKIICIFFLMIAAMLGSFSSQSCKQQKNPSPIVNSSSATDIQKRTERDGMVLIKGGTFLMGTEDGMPFEAPAHEVRVKSFWMDRHEVTVAEFARFMLATGYKTDSERLGWSATFDLKSGQWRKTRG